MQGGKTRKCVCKISLFSASKIPLLSRKCLKLLKTKSFVRESFSRENLSISSFAKVYLAKFRAFSNSRKFIQKISRIFDLAKVSPIKVFEIMGNVEIRENKCLLNIFIWLICETEFPRNTKK